MDCFSSSSSPNGESIRRLINLFLARNLKSSVIDSVNMASHVFDFVDVAVGKENDTSQVTARIVTFSGMNQRREVR